MAQCFDRGVRIISHSGHRSPGWTFYSISRKGISFVTMPGSRTEAIVKEIARMRENVEIRIKRTGDFWSNKNW